MASGHFFYICIIQLCFNKRMKEMKEVSKADNHVSSYFGFCTSGLLSILLTDKPLCFWNDLILDLWILLPDVLDSFVKPGCDVIL